MRNGDRQAGRLVEHGAAPYEHNPENSDSYYVTLENGKGEQRTIWGVDLERAMAEAVPEVGEKIGLQHVGSEPVRLPDGSEVERHSWKVRDAGELAYDQLEKRLSRSGVKETTLDYTRDFAERRGIAETLGVRSEIEIPREREVQTLGREAVPASLGLGKGRDRDQAHDDVSSARVGQHAAENKREDLTQDLRADPREDLAADHGEQSVNQHGQQEVKERQRRNPFEGLKLSRSAAVEGQQQDRAGDNGPQIDQKQPQKAERQRRGMFDGLKLNAGSGSRPGPSQEPGAAGKGRGGAGAAPYRQIGRAGAAAVAA